MEESKKFYYCADAEIRAGFRQLLADALDARFGAGTYEEAQSFLASEEACG